MDQIKLPVSKQQIVIRPISYGISGRHFLAATVFTLAMLITIGLLFAQKDASALVSYLGNIVFELVSKVSIAFLLAAFLAYILLSQVLDYTMTGLVSAFKESRNDSHAILLVGIMFVSAAIVTMAGGTNFNQFLVNILIKGSLALGMGTFLTVLFARLFGVDTMDEFRDWISAEDNDSYAWLVVGFLITSTVLAMSV